MGLVEGGAVLSGGWREATGSKQGGGGGGTDTHFPIEDEKSFHCAIRPAHKRAGGGDGGGGDLAASRSPLLQGGQLPLANRFVTLSPRLPVQFCR